MHAPFRLANTYDVAIGSSSAVSANPVPVGVHAVRLASTVACYVAIGPSPTATTSSALLLPNWPEVFRVRPGEQVAALQVGSAGTLSVAELTF